MTAVTKQLNSSLTPQMYISQRYLEQDGIMHHEAAAIQTQTHLRDRAVVSFSVDIFSCLTAKLQLFICLLYLTTSNV